MCSRRYIHCVGALSLIMRTLNLYFVAICLLILWTHRFTMEEVKDPASRVYPLGQTMGITRDMRTYRSAPVTGPGGRIPRYSEKVSRSITNISLFLRFPDSLKLGARFVLVKKHIFARTHRLRRGHYALFSRALFEYFSRNPRFSRANFENFRQNWAIFRQKLDNFRQNSDQISQKSGRKILRAVHFFRAPRVRAHGAQRRTRRARRTKGRTKKRTNAPKKKTAHRKKHAISNEKTPKIRTKNGPKVRKSARNYHQPTKNTHKITGQRPKTRTKPTQNSENARRNYRLGSQTRTHTK